MLRTSDRNTLFNICDAFIYMQCGKYPYVNDQEGATNTFQLITDLTVSAGTVVLTKNNKNAIFVDGRYLLSAKNNINISKFNICDNNFYEITQWIKNNLEQNKIIAYDSKLFSHEYINKVKENLSEYRFICIHTEDIISNYHKNTRQLQMHSVERIFTDNKFSSLYETIEKHNLDAYLICDPCSISWLLNIRDFHSKYTPVVFGYLLITKHRETILYLDEMYTTVSSPSNLKIIIKRERELTQDIANFQYVGIDSSETPSYLYHSNFINIKNPCLLQKSIKNQIEIADMKSAAQKDSAAIINFLYWLYNNHCKTKKALPTSHYSVITELDVVKKLRYFRNQQPEFIGDSFNCIAAADEHSSMVHYFPTVHSNIAIQKILLLDSGGQYKYGTTDITRTICIDFPTEEQKTFYTLVLKGYIAVANAKIQLGTHGSHLDPLARQFLQQYSTDYNHGTGHGIGYCSHVHEGPIAISRHNHTELKAGMIISNEPGYYKDNEFGIRLENMMLVTADDSFLSLETISFVPFDLNFINKKLLTENEIIWLNNYHQSIIEIMKNHLSNKVLSWLISYSTENQ